MAERKFIRNIPVLFENEACIVLDKPAGLAVQDGAGVGASLDSILSACITPRPLLVHRLDKDTSGVIIAAKTRESATLLSSLFQDFKESFSSEKHYSSKSGKNLQTFKIVKKYTALCVEIPPRKEGIIRFDLEVKGVVKKAETRYKTLEEYETADGEVFSLVEAELGTGRMHQIRRHLAMSGCPIVGDDKYGDFKLNKRLRKERGVKRMLLHASRLIIPAETGFPLDVSSPLPPYFFIFC